MKFTFGKGGNVKVLTVFEDTKKLDNDNGLLEFLREKEVFEGKPGSIYFDLNLEDDSILLVGLGKEEDVTIDSLRKAYHSVGKELMKQKVKEVQVELPQIGDLAYFDIVGGVTEGLLQSESVFDKYLSTKKVNPTVEKVFYDVLDNDKELAKEAVEETEIIFEGIELTRDLVNERAINMYPEVLANEAKSNLEPLGIEVEILDREAIEEKGMEALLAVAEGSDKDPRFFTMTYKGDPNDDEVIALVGKGLTYDSGGYSLKPSNSMDTMFTDMTGSATVIGSLLSIAKAGLKKNVVGIVAATENLVSGSAYKPGDIIGSYAGKTIEVLNTDAEGRLTLADALWYAVNDVKADKVIDLATLTGACVVALGETTTGAVTNNAELMEEIIEAGNKSGEPIWELPAFDEYKEMIKSPYADLVNTNVGGVGAGTITAGLFLGEFVDETPWVHLDIAGTSHTKSARGYLPQGATGVHVKTLFNYIKNA